VTVYKIIKERGLRRIFIYSKMYTGQLEISDKDVLFAKRHWDHQIEEECSPRGEMRNI
jgi:hypothetical protein